MSSPPEEAPAFPERVGKYELLMPIGTGGMATVYLARVAVVGDVHREVALKLLHPFVHAEEQDSASSLIEEAKLATRIRHPNVIPVVEVGEGPQGVFLVMDYVEGDTLSGLNRTVRGANATIPLPVAGRILLDSLAGLHAAHELRDDLGQPLDLVHRDFSPQNILVGVDGISRLTDFGIAKAAGRANVTSSGVIKGKVAYMAPEQALGKKVDRRCDVWAAGVVAWEILAGRRLYKQEDQVATLLKIVQEPPPRLRSVRPEIPQALDDAIAAALTMDVESRIGTARELRKRLGDAWRAELSLADAHDVGEYVAQVAGQKIDARREQVSRVIRVRARKLRVESASLPVEDRLTPSGPIVRPGPGEEQTTISASSVSTPSDLVGMHPRPDLPSDAIHRPRRKRLMLGVATVAVVLAAVAVVAVTLTGRRPEPPALAAVASAAPAAPVEQPKPAPAPAAPTAPEQPTELSITANAPIKSLTVGGAPVPVEQPSRVLAAKVGADARDRALAVEATSVDGRRASAERAAGSKSVTLSFPAAGRASSGSTRPPAVRDSAKPPELPGLAPTPYGQ